MTFNWSLPHVWTQWLWAPPAAPFQWVSVVADVVSLAALLRVFYLIRQPSTSSLIEKWLGETDPNAEITGDRGRTWKAVKDAFRNWRVSRVTKKIRAREEGEGAAVCLYKAQLSNETTKSERLAGLLLELDDRVFKLEIRRRAALSKTIAVSALGVLSSYMVSRKHDEGYDEFLLSVARSCSLHEDTGVRLSALTLYEKIAPDASDECLKGLFAFIKREANPGVIARACATLRAALEEDKVNLFMGEYIEILECIPTEECVREIDVYLGFEAVDFTPYRDRLLKLSDKPAYRNSEYLAKALRKAAR